VCVCVRARARWVVVVVVVVVVLVDGSPSCIKLMSNPVESSHCLKQTQGTVANTVEADWILSWCF
jgi:hypothetical protein